MTSLLTSPRRKSSLLRAGAHHNCLWDVKEARTSPLHHPESHRLGTPFSQILQKNALESRSLPLLASQAGSLNGGLDSMPEWLSWSCWADWLLAVPVQDHSVHCLATASPCIAGRGPVVPAKSSVSRASDALVRLRFGSCRPACHGRTV